MPQVKIYSKDPCPYCVNAKRLLNEKNIKYQEIDLTNNPTELERLKKETGWRTVPMIFIGEELVGGYSDLRALEDAGKLDAMVAGRKT